MPFRLIVGSQGIETLTSRHGDQARRLHFRLPVQHAWDDAGNLPQPMALPRPGPETVMRRQNVRALRQTPFALPGADQCRHVGKPAGRHAARSLPAHGTIDRHLPAGTVLVSAQRPPGEVSHLDTRAQHEVAGLIGLKADLLADNGGLAAAAEGQHLEPSLDNFDLELTARDQLAGAEVIALAADLDRMAGIRQHHAIDADVAR